MKIPNNPFFPFTRNATEVIMSQYIRTKLHHYHKNCILWTKENSKNNYYNYLLHQNSIIIFRPYSDLL